MTAGNNGTPEPGDDDPFGYLYRGDGEQNPPAAGQPGVPRTSYHQVSRVGERRQAPGGGYGYPQQPPAQPYGQQQPGYGQQPGPAYPADGQTQRIGQAGAGLPGQPGPGRAAGGHGGGHGARGGSNNRGLMIGAIAVVVVVAVGIAIAVATGDNKKNDRAGGGTPTSTGTAPQSPAGTASADPNANLPQQFAAALDLGGKATVVSTDKGAKGPNGSYVTMTNIGDSATWSVTVPADGSYSLYLRYGNAGAPATATLTINGTAQTRPANLDNFTKQSDPAHAWTQTYSYVDLRKGANTIELSCQQGDQCAFDLDKLWLKKH